MVQKLDNFPLLVLGQGHGAGCPAQRSLGDAGQAQGGGGGAVVARKAHPQHQADQRGGHQHPHHRAAVAEQGDDALLRVLLPKGEGDGAGDPRVPAQMEQGSGVFCGAGVFLVIQAAQDRLIRRHLDVQAEQAVGDPEDGVKPVQAQQDIGQGLEAVVPAADVGLLMQEDIAPLLRGQPHGEIDARAEKAQDEGAVDLVRLVNMLGEEHGVVNALSQAAVRHHAPERSHSRPRRPDAEGDRRPMGGLRNGHFAGGGFRGGCGLHPLRRPAGGRGGLRSARQRAGGGQHELGDRPVRHPLGHQAHRQGNAHRAGHAEEHHQPQPADQRPRQFIEKQPGHHHAQRRQRGRQAHAQ